MQAFSIATSQGLAKLIIGRSLSAEQNICGRYVGHAIERTIYYFASQVDGSQAVAWVD